MASHLSPSTTPSRQQSRQHFVADSAWSDEEMLQRVAQWVVPAMDFQVGGWWIADDTGFLKQGRHSVGVARQYRAMLGKQDNCQVTVSVSLARQAGSSPVAWQLYLPKEWADDATRREKAGVPQDAAFATKPAIALAQVKRLMAQGAPRRSVLADAGHGVETAFREALSEIGLTYVVGMTGAVTVWHPRHEPLPPPAYSGRGVAPAVDQGAGVRAGAVAVAGHRVARGQQRPEEWLLIDWPEGHEEPMKCWLSTLGEDVPLQRMAFEAKMHRRIERDNQDLKQEVGLGHHEGRGLRGCHHHASLSIAA